MSKLWQKQSNRDEARDLFCEFTTGNDYQLDGAYFIEYDIIASKAWAIALQGCGIYTADECVEIIRALDNINKSYKSGTFSVRLEDEDCHTAIENALVLMTGEIGKKIHTGRSRNDQSLTMIRLFMRNSLCTMISVFFLSNEIIFKAIMVFPYPHGTSNIPPLPSCCEFVDNGCFT